MFAVVQYLHEGNIMEYMNLTFANGAPQYIAYVKLN